MSTPTFSNRFTKAGVTPPSEQELHAMIVEGDSKALVTVASRLGRELAENRLTKAQIRNVFGTVRQIEASWQSVEDSVVSLRQLVLLQPKLAYQAARNAPVKPLKDVLTDAINMVAEASDPSEQLERFGRFVDLFEAILAYHTEAGGR